MIPTTELTLEQIEEIECGCEGVTPGPWESDSTKSEGSYGSGEDVHEGFDAFEVIAPALYPGGRPVIVCDTLNSDAGAIEEEWDEDGHSAWDEQGRKNMAHIARLDPSTVRALCTLARKGLAGADWRDDPSAAAWNRRTPSPSPAPGVVDALRECVTYIRSPLRMTRDEDEEARRARVVDRAVAALASLSQPAKGAEGGE